VTKVFCSNLDWDATDNDVVELFENVGRARSAKIIMGPDGRSRGFALIEMTDVADCARAISQLDEFVWRGRTLHVALAQREKEGITTIRNSRTASSHSRSAPGNCRTSSSS
jgi:RNA recognition motif-containing protein